MEHWTRQRVLNQKDGEEKWETLVAQLNAPPGPPPWRRTTSGERATLSVVRPADLPADAPVGAAAEAAAFDAYMGARGRR